eukprot:GGOE01027448.1.p2 GENE.GGOE01027448.1~~GGOE01027448.1.p2  ORF type:complete len:102 (-),score=2.14 GGOE01027448.1:50-355(-)
MPGAVLFVPWFTCVCMCVTMGTHGSWGGKVEEEGGTLEQVSHPMQLITRQHHQCCLQWNARISSFLKQKVRREQTGGMSYVAGDGWADLHECRVTMGEAMR